MDTNEYQQLNEELRRLSVEMKELGEKQAEWSEEDRDTWGSLEAAYDKAVAQKQEEDQRRQAMAVQERLEQIDQPPATVNLPKRVLAKRTAVPDSYQGRLLAFRDDAQQSAQEKAYDCGLWLRSALWRDPDSLERLGRRQPEWRQQVIGTPSAGGYTVPTPLSTTVIEVMNEVGAALRVSDIYPMTANTLDISKLISGQTVYYPGEAAAITESETLWGQVNLTAIKRATLTKVSNELMADSIIAFAERVARRAAYEIAFNMDREFIVGDGAPGSGNVTGLASAIGDGGTHQLATTNTAWSDIGLADFHRTKGLLPSRFYAGQLYWIMRRDFWASVVEPIMYGAGGNTVTNLEGGTMPTFLGYPAVFSDHMPPDDAGNYACFFGNFTEAVALGQRTDINIARSDDFAFNEDVTTIRVTSRYDIQIHEPGDGSNAGAYVGLQLADS